MKSRRLLIVFLIVGFAAATYYALNRELEREETMLRQSISGRITVSPKLYREGIADIVKTDRIVLILVDPATGKPAALKFDSPFVPPLTYVVGQEDSGGRGALSGNYYLVGISDKDGEIFNITPGEIYGRSETPIALGSEQIELVLDAPFRGSLFNGSPPAGIAGTPHTKSGGSGDDPSNSISGTIEAAAALAGNVSPDDRLVILAFDPQQSRPIAFKILPNAKLPQRFSIAIPRNSLPQGAAGVYLRVLTDKDENPFKSAPGEIIGRSQAPIPPGTHGLEFVMDRPYTR